MRDSRTRCGRCSTRPNSPAGLDPTRRQILVGGLAGAVAGLFARPAWASPLVPPRATSAILIWLDGGPSHIDTFDPKPGAATAGEFGAVGTSIEGAQISEHLPGLSQQIHRGAIIRSMTSPEADHDRANYYLHTGNRPQESVRHPAWGALHARYLADAEDVVPPYVVLGTRSANAPGAGLLGDVYAPFVLPELYEGVTIGNPADVSPERWERRIRVLREMHQHVDAAAQTHAELLDRSDRYVHGPMGEALDLSTENQRLRDAYGYGYGYEEAYGIEAGQGGFGQACLVARRLVERDVRFVEVVLGGWDTHADNFTNVANLSRVLDGGLSTLLQDLEQRGRLESTLVLCMGEFGRTPDINATNGRDHHSDVFSAVIAGGGIRGGQVVGASDEGGYAVADRPVTIENLYATIADLTGIDPTRQHYTPEGRPIRILETPGEPIQELL